MMYRIIDLPENVIGFKALWKVTDKDFEEVMAPSVNHHLKQSNQFNCLLVLSNFTDNIKLNTLKIFKHLRHCRNKCKRIAVVTESKANKKIIEFLNLFFKAELKEFSNTEYKEAINWTSQNPS